MINQKAEELYKDKRVLVFGLGVNQGGLGAARFFAQAGAQVRVTDLKTEDELKVSLDELKEFSNIEYTLGQHREEDFDWADLIIKNPGVKPGNKYLEYAKLQGKQIEMDMGILLEFISPDRIVGVTGTKGKSTTSSLIYQTLSRHCEENHDEAISQVLYAGNIGKSVLDVIPHLTDETLLVLEISSFQLEGFEPHRISPKYSVITNILPDHLNYYQNMKQYAEAKRIIARFQKPGDFLFINISDPITNSPRFLEALQAKVIYFSEFDLPDDFEPTLPGAHNKANYAASLKVAKVFEIREKDALNYMNEFKGVEFRQQLIREWNGVKIINDTAATGPNATIASLKTYPNCILIAGGVNKNLPYEDLSKLIDESVKAVYFLEGDATETIKSQMENQDKIKGTFNNFEELLNALKPNLEKGDTVVLSPGAASFNLFQNEFDRGRKFNNAVEKIFTE